MHDNCFKKTFEVSVPVRGYEALVHGNIVFVVSTDLVFLQKIFQDIEGTNNLSKKFN